MDKSEVKRSTTIAGAIVVAGLVGMLGAVLGDPLARMIYDGNPVSFTFFGVLWLFFGGVIAIAIITTSWRRSKSAAFMLGTLGGVAGGFFVDFPVSLTGRSHRHLL